MKYASSQKSGRRILEISIKAGIAVAFAWMLIVRFGHKEITDAFIDIFTTEVMSRNQWMLWTAIVLMPCNWFCEMLKWRVLMQPSVTLSWRSSIGGILCGITVSFFTPNRIGEYAGRILFVEPKYNWRTVVASLTGSFVQNLVHITCGIVAIILFFGAMPGLPYTTKKGIWVLLALILAALWLCYAFLPRIAAAVTTLRVPRWLQKPQRALTHLAGTPRKILAQSALLALIRYAIFTTQYVLLLMFFGATIQAEWLFAGVAVIYLMHTSIPLPPFIDLVARNELGILLWAGMGVNELCIVAAGFSVWILNLVIPAFFGLVAIGSVNVLKNLGYEANLASSSSSEPDRGAVAGTQNDTRS